MQLPANLSQRELQVLEMLARGAKNRQIAVVLGLSAYTVKRHIARILSKMKVASRSEAAAIYWHDVDFPHWDGVDPDASSASPVPVTAPSRDLTRRELEVLKGIAQGASAQQIAGELLISFHTVKRHTSSIFGKLGVKSRSHATAWVYAARRALLQASMARLPARYPNPLENVN